MYMLQDTVAYTYTAAYMQNIATVSVITDRCLSGYNGLWYVCLHTRVLVISVQYLAILCCVAYHE